MNKGGRPKDPIWQHFDLVEDGTKKSAQCQKCLVTQSVKVCRMKAHYEKCRKQSTSVYELNDNQQAPVVSLVQAIPQKHTPTEHAAAPPPKCIQTGLDDRIVRTPTSTKELIDDKVAEYMFACNLPFSLVEHPSFKSLLTVLHPGYQPPARTAISSKHLDKTHEKLQAHMKTSLTGKEVTMQQDGWSTLQNDPVIATSITCEGKGYFIDAKNTETEKKTAEKCKEMLQDSKTYAETMYGYKVKSVVTDNAKNMEKI